ncbi:MAG: phytoene/squalene synthase family protein [Bacteroidia bacterium]
MQSLFDNLSLNMSKQVTHAYSTSFSSAVRLLAPDIRIAIHSIYGFVRLADEIVDSFNTHDQEQLLDAFEKDYYHSLDTGISLNPIVHSFQQTVSKYAIPQDLVKAFLRSMRKDLYKQNYATEAEYKDYIYGSADVVGLMCLKVFVQGDDMKYEMLKESAMRLGSAFQKVNFLRDLKADTEDLERSYFPNVDFNELDQTSKQNIISEIESDFEQAYKGIIKLPKSSKFGVYTAYKYYKKLLKKLKQTPSQDIINQRIRVSDSVKMGLLFNSYINIKLGLI